MAKRIESEKLDVTKYVGTKADIVVAEVKEGKYGAVMFLQTNPIDLKEEDKLPDDKFLTASIMLGLVKDKEGNLGIATDSKADIFCKAQGVDVEKDLPDKLEVGTVLKVFLGKTIVCQKNANDFLEIA